MTRCDRFEREGIARLQQGLPLDDHFAGCPDCRAARAAYESLQRSLAEVGDGFEPPAGWQREIWAAIERRRRTRGRRWLWTLAPAGAAAALFALVLLRPVPPGPSAAALQVTVVPGAGSAHRGTDARPGDRLDLTATTAGSELVELRVYFNDTELVLSCSSEAPCRRDNGRLHAAIELQRRGTYQGMLLASEREIPAALPDLDADSGAAIDAGATVELGPEIRVR